MRRTLLATFLLTLLAAPAAPAATVPRDPAPVSEADPAIVVPLTRPATQRPETWTVTVSGQTGGPVAGAKLGEDFTIDALTVEFAAGQTTAEIRVPLVDDDVSERPEYVVLRGSHPDYGTFGTSVLVRDDDPAWPKPVVTVNEGKGLVTFNLEQGPPGPFAPPLAITGGSAAAGVDVGPPTAVFVPGLSYGTFTLPIVKDMVPEDDEDVLVSFTKQPRDRTTGAVRTLRIVIRDDDGAFAKPTLTAPKRARLGSPVPVAVRCPRKCAGTVSVRLGAAQARRLGVPRVLVSRRVVLQRSGERSLRLVVPPAKLRRAAPLTAQVLVRTVSGKGRAKTATAPVTLVR